MFRVTDIVLYQKERELQIFRRTAFLSWAARDEARLPWAAKLEDLDWWHILALGTEFSGATRSRLGRRKVKGEKRKGTAGQGLVLPRVQSIGSVADLQRKTTLQSKHHLTR